MNSEPDNISHLFGTVLESTLSKTTLSNSQYTGHKVSISSVSKEYLKTPVPNENKSKRQDAILSFINERKSVGIKDIAALFSDTSEKTIQRELATLVATGKVSKRGEKRWSIYMSIN